MKEPRYDRVFAEGARWLDELAGTPLDPPPPAVEPPCCPTCEGKGYLTPDDAARAIRERGEMFNAGYAHAKAVE
jgi:hypothetical protein